MADLRAEELNVILVDTFNVVRRVEENALKKMHTSDLSISEYHLIECISKGGDNGLSISEIASELSITLASVTVAVNKLVRKGYATKTKSETDGRVVYVTLTRQGKKVNAGHRYFHRQMVRQISNEFTDDEIRLLTAVIKKVSAFFKANNYFLDNSEKHGGDKR